MNASTPAIDAGRRRSSATIHARREVAIAIVTGRRRARRRKRAHQTADHRLRERGQRVDRGDADRAGADEPHLRAPDGHRVRGERHAGSRRAAWREDRHRDDPRDAPARPASPCRPRARPGAPRRTARATTRRRSRSTRRAPSAKKPVTSAAAMRVDAEDREPARRRPCRASTARSPSRASPASSVDFAARAGADLQHFRRRDPFGVGQIGVRDQRAAQRNREQHAEHAAAHADQERLPEREAGPPADDHESRAARR